MSVEEIRPHLRIVRGQPSAEEIAVTVAVLAAASGGGQEQHQGGPASQWAPPERLMRGAVHPSGWWAAALPR